jgi:hypothetical protein
LPVKINSLQRTLNMDELIDDLEIVETLTWRIQANIIQAIETESFDDMIL